MQQRKIEHICIPLPAGNPVHTLYRHRHCLSPKETPSFIAYFRRTFRAWCLRSLRTEDVTFVQWSGKVETREKEKITTPLGFACLEASHLPCFEKRIQENAAFPQNFREKGIRMIQDTMRDICAKVLHHVRTHRQSIAFTFRIEAYGDTVTEAHPVSPRPPVAS